MRERFLAGGPDALPDYELLELVLFNGIPQKDVKPLAKELIARFGSYGAVMADAVGLTGVAFVPTQVLLLLVVGGMALGCLGGFVVARTVR